MIGLIDQCSGPQFKCITINNFKIDIKSIASCYIGFIKEKQLYMCKVVNICFINSVNVLIVKFFSSIEPFFDNPINSIKLEIAIVNNLSNELVSINLNNINIKKYMILTNAKSLKIAYPVLHSSLQTNVPKTVTFII